MHRRGLADTCSRTSSSCGDGHDRARCGTDVAGLKPLFEASLMVVSCPYGRKGEIAWRPPQFPLNPPIICLIDLRKVMSRNSKHASCSWRLFSNRLHPYSNRSAKLLVSISMPWRRRFLQTKEPRSPHRTRSWLSFLVYGRDRSFQTASTAEVQAARVPTRTTRL